MRMYWSSGIARRLTLTLLAFAVLPLAVEGQKIKVEFDKNLNFVNCREFAASLCSYRGKANNRSAQLPQEKADTHLDVAVDLSLAGGCGHEMAAAHTLVESNTTHVDLFAFERAGEPYRIGRDLPSQVRTPAKLAMSWRAGLFGD